MDLGQADESVYWDMASELAANALKAESGVRLDELSLEQAYLLCGVRSKALSAPPRGWLLQAGSAQEEQASESDEEEFVPGS
eukprot:5932547-Prorocentrum_lima.AAC.1